MQWGRWSAPRPLQKRDWAESRVVGHSSSQKTRRHSADWIWNPVCLGYKLWGIVDDVYRST